MSKGKLKKLVLPLVLAIAMMSTMLYGCGPKEEATVDEPTEATETETTEENSDEGTEDREEATDEEQDDTEKPATNSDAGAPDGINDAVTFGEGTKTSPVPFGEWGEISLYSSKDKTQHPAYMRITAVSNDASYTQECLDLHNSIYSFPITLEEMELPSDVKLNVVDYEVYIPADFPSSESGVYSTEMSLSVVNPEGGGIPTADGTASYIGLSSVRNMDKVENPEYLPGSTYQLRAYFAMVDGYTDYVFETYNYPIGTTDDTTEDASMVYDYFACK